MVSEKIIKTGLGVGSFLGGMAVGHFVMPTVAEMVTVPQWAKDINITATITHSSIPNGTADLEKRFYTSSITPGGVQSVSWVLTYNGHPEAFLKIENYETQRKIIAAIWAIGSATYNMYKDDVFGATLSGVTTTAVYQETY